MSDDSKPATPKIATVPLPAPPPIPRLIDSPGHKTPMPPAAGAVVNVGDLVARLGDGSGCPGGHWPRTHDPVHDRRAFAAHFVGCSTTHADPTRVRHGTGPVGRLEIQTGGNWWFPVRGPIAKDDPLGLAVVNGALSPAVLEACPQAEAIAVAIAAEGPGWRVKLLGPK